MAIGVTFELFGKSGGFVRAAGRAKLAMNQLKTSVRSFASSKAVQFLGGAALVGTFTALGTQAIDLGSKISDLAEQLRIGAEELQVFLAVGLKAGVSQADMEKALRNVTIRTQEALDGNKLYRESIERLGFDMKVFSGLDTDKKIIAIAHAYEKAGKSQEAYADVARILGTKAGPKMLEVFRRINSEGFSELTKGAIESGQVLEDHTIASLDAAADAIGRFKLAAQVAVGNIIVNFQTEEGLKLMGLQLSKAVSIFGLKIVDAVTYPAKVAHAVFSAAFGGAVNFMRDGLLDVVALIAGELNKVLPERFEINVGNLEQFKSDGQTVADAITRAIADTNPTAASDWMAKAFDESIAKQRLAIKAAFVEAQPVAKVVAATVADGGKDAGNALIAGAKAVAAASGEVVKAAGALGKGFGGMTTSKHLADLSDDALREMIRRDSSVSADEKARARGAFTHNAGMGNRMTAARLDSNIAAAERELDFRRDLRRDVNSFGMDHARRNSTVDPRLFDMVVAKVVTGQENSDVLVEESKITNRLLRGKFKPE